MHEIGRELDHIGEARALRRQRSLDIGEDLAALRIEIVGADDLAAPLGCHLAGDEQELGRLDARELRILAQRFAERVGVLDRDVGHDGPRSFAARSYAEIAWRSVHYWTRCPHRD